MKSVAAGVLVACALASPQQPSFRAATDIVAIDVSVEDRNGVPVRDLQAGDFVVRIDGQPRRLVSAQYIDQRPRPAGTRPAYSSNESDDTGRLVVLVVDQESLQFGNLRPVAESVGRLLSGLGAADKVGLALFPGPRMVVTFSADRQQVVDAMKRIPGSQVPRQVSSLYTIGVAEAYQMERGNESIIAEAINRECGAALRERDAAAVAACRESLTNEARQILLEARRQSASFLASMRALLEMIAPIPAPKTVIVFSQGLALPDATADMGPLGADAAAARATIHAVRLDRTLFDVDALRQSGSIYEDRAAARAGLEAVVGRARGTVEEMTAAPGGQYDRLAAQMAGYYLLGIEAIPADRDGKRHRIDVTTRRPAATLRAREEFVIAPPVPARASADAETKRLNDALKSPATVPDLPIRLTTFSLADDDASRVRVLVSAEIDRQQERAGAASVGYVIYGPTGKVAANLSSRTDLERTPSGALRFVGATSIPAGAYTVRLAAVRGDRAGSVEHRFTAGLAVVGTLRLGDLLLTDASEAKVQLAPPADAHLATDGVLALVQMRVGAGAPKDATFTLDIAKTDGAPALVSAPVSLGAPKNGMQAASARVDVRLLPPGDYRARFTVALADRTARTLLAPLSLTAPPRGAGPGASVKGGASGAALPGGQAGAPPGEPPFNPADVLAPAVVTPFLDELAARSPGTSTAGLAAARAGRFDEALKELKGGPSDPLVAFVRGLALLAKDDPQGASDAFRDSMRATPDFLGGAFYIGACYASGGRDVQAVNAWLTSLAGLDRFPVVYRVLAGGLLRIGRMDRAVEMLDDASTRWPDDETLKLSAARAELLAGLRERALARIDDVIGRHPDDASLLFIGLQTAYEVALRAPDAGRSALLSRMEKYRDLYAAANGPRQALVAEWLAYLARKQS